MGTKDPNCLRSFPKGMLGEPLKDYGMTIMEIQVGALWFDHMCVVVDIVDEVLLMEDLFICDSSGPTDIIQSKGKMTFRGAIIPLTLLWLLVVRHVTTTESVEVPPTEEVMVAAYLDRHDNQEEEDNRLLVEMHPYLLEG